MKSRSLGSSIGERDGMRETAQKTGNSVNSRAVPEFAAVA